MFLGNRSGLVFHGTAEQTCDFVEKFQWRQRFLTSEVHVNFALTAAVNVLTCPLSIWVNTVVIFIIFSNETLKNIPSNLFFALMSVTDLGSSLVAQPLFIASTSCRLSGHCSTCAVDLARNISLIFFTVLSVFHLVLMAIDRLISIMFPYRYPGIVTTRTITAAVASSWVVAFIHALIPFISSEDTVMEDIGRAVIALCVIAAVFVNLCYLVIYLESKKHQIAIQAQLNQTHQESQNIEFKAAKTTFLVTSAVGVTHLINGVANAVSGWVFLNSDSESSRNQFFSMECWSLTLILLNSFFNPLIYTMRSEAIAFRFKRLHLQRIESARDRTRSVFSRSTESTTM